MDIRKYIPWQIKIKSLYWVIKEKEIDYDLKKLFDLIDNGEFNEGRVMLSTLRMKWELFSQSAPKWFQMEYPPQFVKAESIISFLEITSDLNNSDDQ